MRRPSVRTLCVLAVLSACVLATGCAGAGYQGRSKPRTIRGFKNVALSTARGFGKRAGAGAGGASAATAGPDASAPAFGPSPLDFFASAAAAPMLEQLAERSTNSVPVDWFVEEMQNNPQLTRLIVHKFVDANQDGELSPEELLRPLY